LQIDSLRDFPKQRADQKHEAKRKSNRYKDRIGSHAFSLFSVAFHLLGARLLIREIEIDNGVNPLETVILGDMNAKPDFSTIAEFLGSSLGLTDLTDKIEVSFYNYGKAAGKIDYVFAIGALAEDFEMARIWDDVHSGIYLSDHYPIEVSFK
jgi:endonuclease/exonuclease/phosphatase family metal-dependent hydrolase